MKCWWLKPMMKLGHVTQIRDEGFIIASSLRSEVLGANCQSWANDDKCLSMQIAKGRRKGRRGEEAAAGERE